MKLFARRKKYSQDELAEYASHIEKYNRLRDSCMQKLLLSSKDPVRAAIYQAEIERCDSVIKHALIAQDHMFKKNGRD